VDDLGRNERGMRRIKAASLMGKRLISPSPPWRKGRMNEYKKENKEIERKVGTKNRKSGTTYFFLE